MRYGLSDRYKTVNRNTIEREQQYLVNLSYDVNPAMRFGLEWDYIKTRYANYSAATPPIYDKSGKMHAVRIGAWYFF
jgi:predicted porin